jgi:hypothetical protein
MKASRRRKEEREYGPFAHRLQRPTQLGEHSPNTVFRVFREDMRLIK